MRGDCQQRVHLVFLVLRRVESEYVNRSKALLRRTVARLVTRGCWRIRALTLLQLEPDKSACA